MNVFSTLLVSAPNDLWSNLITKLNGALGNYGWAILLLTIIVKLIVSPLDFMVKYSTKKQTLIQQKCAPQVAKLNKKFGKDQNTLRIQTQSLYKREGLNLGTGCIVMLINMVLTMVIFFTFYSSLRKVSAYESVKQYEILANTFETTQNQLVVDNSDDIYYQTATGTITTENVESFVKDWNKAQQINIWLTENPTKTKDDYQLDTSDTNNNVDYYIDLYNNNKDNPVFVEIDTQTKDAVYEKWSNEVKDSWLWIDNIWVADAPINAFPDYDSLLSLAQNGGYEDYVRKNVDKATCNTIFGVISQDSNYKSNGFYILAILAGVITFLQQYISELHNKLKNKRANKVAKATADPSNAGSMKVLKIILPIIMVIFVLTSTATFGIYILASNIIAIALGEVSTIIINKLTKKKQQEVEQCLEKEAMRMIKKGQMED